jgi:Domain of unknown function (DUF4382)/Domain of unknown function (DUF5666)
MKSLRAILPICLVVILMCAASILVSCGGGSGGSSTVSGAAPSGNVAILLNDGPADNLSALNLWISKVSLIPSGDADEVVLVENHPEEINILQYREEPLLFTLKEVPSGNYEKIRLTIDRVSASGDGTCAEMTIKLPSGKIDLNPRGGFQVQPGETLNIKLDIDANKSIQLHEAGNSGKCIFRPVIFVTIERAEDAPSCPAALKGEVVKLNRDSTTTPETLQSFEIDLVGQRGNLLVTVSAETIIFDGTGALGDTSDIELGRQVYVRGFVQSDGSLLASLIVVGDLLKVRGVVGEGVTDTGFTLILDPDQEITDPSVAVSLSSDSRIYVGCDTEVGIADIQPGMRATVVGKISVQDGALLAIIVLLEPYEIQGTLQSIQDGDNGYDLTILTASETQEHVFLPAGLPVLLEGDGEVSISDLQALTTCSPSYFPAVRVLLEPSDPSQARKMIVIPAEISGLVSAISGDTTPRTLTIEAITVELQSDALIQKKEGDVVSEASLSDMLNQQVTVYGLPVCGSDTVFQGYIVNVE